MKSILFLIALTFTVVGPLGAQDILSTRKKQFNLDNGVAIRGYDPVAYFLQNKAVKGNRDNAILYEGVLYHFSTAANKEEFRKNPSKYEPEYGGWCAYAMGDSGDKVEVDPKTFKILGGKLYLFYNKLFTNTLPSWNKNESALKKKADANWQNTFH